MPVKYNFYATILDSFNGYQNSDAVWQKYWGYSENPPHTPEEFHELQFTELINRINRVPFDNEKADRGTAFNEIVDCLILGCKSDKMEIASNREMGTITATYNNRTFTFPISICRDFADYYKGAIPQVRVEAILPTFRGDVMLYGYLDELMPMSIHDIKTTTRYSVGKFKDNWQHIVYPYALSDAGNVISDFEYNVLLITERKSGDTYEIFTEHYAYVADRDIPLLTSHVEQFIEFLEENRGLITDKKIFNEHVIN